MSNITVWSAMKEATSAIDTVVSTYRKYNIIKKHESAILKDKLRALRTILQMQEIGEITRAMIKEITQTQSFIDRQNLSDEALKYAMECLEEMSLNLKKIMEDHRNEIYC